MTLKSQNYKVFASVRSRSTRVTLLTQSFIVTVQISKVKLQNKQNVRRHDVIRPFLQLQDYVHQLESHDDVSPFHLQFIIIALSSCGAQVY